MKVQILDKFLPEDFFKQTIIEYVDLISSNEMHFCKEFGRLYAHRSSWFDYLHKTIVLEQAKKLFGNDIVPSYNFLSYYMTEHSICRLHTDRFPMCQYTLDLCVFQNEPWDIYVNFIPYKLKPNQALSYSGTGMPHYREWMKKDNKVALAFFHFSDSVYAKMDLN